jgi:membrane protease YdiL (CAAX protease family)
MSVLPGDETTAELPFAEPIPSPPPAPLRRMRPDRAALEVILCSDFPTQFAIGALLASMGVVPLESGQLSLRFVYLISAIDTVVLLTLITVLLRLSGDRPRDVFLGARHPSQELLVGLAFVPVAFALVMVLQVVIQLGAPFLRTVPENPFQSLLGSPLRVAGFVLLVLVAGGVREELQRAFLLRRFETSLGGARVGLVVTSAAFGLGHIVQGWDAVVVTATLGALWSAVYLWRRSVIPTIVSHSLFNVGEVLLGAYVLSS